MKKIFKFTCMFLCLLFLGIVLTACGGGGGGSTGGGGFAYFPTTNTSDNSVNNPSDNNGGDNTGNSGDNTGNNGDNTGNSGDNTGNNGDNTGNSGDNTGNTGDNTGNSGDNTGNSGDTTPTPFANAQVGDYVTIGNYPQTATGEVQPIEWQVLARDNDNNKILVVSHYGLESKRFDDNSNIWSISEIRQWLNSDFYNGAFNDTEKSYIKSSYLSDVFTTDNIFLLSKDERIIYFPNADSRKCEPTAYAVTNGSFKNDEGYSYWWLRSLSSNTTNPCVLCGYPDGNSGDNIYTSKYIIRPAMWVKLNTGDNGNIEDNENTTPSPFANLQVGDSVTIGKYNYTKNGTNMVYSITWQVLARDEENHRALVISQRALSKQTTSRNWSSSTICKWLNGIFYNNTFTDTEKSFIIPTKLSDLYPAENNCIFLLSKTEAETYFADNDARRCREINFNTNDAYNGYSYWWLRTPYGTDIYGIYCVTYEGKIIAGSTCQYSNPNSPNYRGVRPAMWIKI